MISIVDYGMGNSGSIANMLRYLGAECNLVNDPESLANSSAIILPGVGSFDNGVEKLQPFIRVLNELVIEKKVPFLGICLGMQLLFENSEEGQLPGLGWIRGNVVKFDFNETQFSNLKVPHMGWNLVKPEFDVKSTLYFPEQSRFYFVHSFHVQCEDDADVFATTCYGYDFTCAVRRDNIWGAQFHPEKSHKFGFNFFRCFIEELKNA